MSAVLTPQELEELTQKLTPGRQKRVLEFMRIPIHKERPDGSLVVRRIDAYGLQEATTVVKREPRVRSLS